MKKIILLIGSMLVFLASQAELPEKTSLEKRISEIEDRMALKELVDKFSILSDIKHAQAQALLFTENAIVETYNGNTLSSTLNGRAEIASVFGNFLQRFESVYHLNGQQTVEISENKATGIAYCLVTLIGTENDKKMITTHGVYYQDNYVREKNGTWLIDKRKSTFLWTEKRELHP